MPKKIFFSTFFSHNLPTGTSLQSKKLNFLLKLCVKILFCRHYFNPLNTFMRKGKDPGDPKTCGSCGSGSGSPTLLLRNWYGYVGTCLYSGLLKEEEN
jgi:hypothetical protein